MDAQRSPPNQLLFKDSELEVGKIWGEIWELGVWDSGNLPPVSSDSPELLSPGKWELGSWELQIQF